jgi:hypothetical protein
MKRFLAPILILCAAAATAQEATSTTPVTTTSMTTTATTTAGTGTTYANDAATVRQEFRELMERHPPQVGRVLKLDPMLFNNQQYLASYPAIAAYIANHPDITHNPSYYLQYVWVPGDERPETSSERIWRDAMEGFSIFLAMGLVATILSWLVKTLVEHRRWSRLSKVQYEVHNKLMDRFASNEDLLRYIQTPSGKRFLESAPLQLDSAPAQRPAAPINRILWSVQVGMVVVAAGIGLEIVSKTIDKNVAEPMFVFGVLALSVGIGFVVSSAVSYLLSRRLGLLTVPPAAAPEPSVSLSE